MKKTIFSYLIAVLTLSAPLVSPSLANAAVSWDFIGNWHLQYNIAGFPQDLSFNLANENFSTGTLSGTDVYHDSITGSISGNIISLYDSGTTVDFVGTVASNGTIAGGGNYGYGAAQSLTQPNLYGYFYTITGQAVSYPVPEPATYGIFSGIGLFAMAVFRGGRFKYAVK